MDPRLRDLDVFFKVQSEDYWVNDLQPRLIKRQETWRWKYPNAGRLCTHENGIDLYPDWGQCPMNCEGKVLAKSYQELFSVNRENHRRGLIQLDL